MASLLPQIQLPLIPGAPLRMTSIGLVVDCPNCGIAIPVTICQSDKNGNAGKPMARHPQCAFFKWFPELLSWPDIMARIPLSSPRIPVSSTSASIPPSLSSPHVLSTSSIPFVGSQLPSDFTHGSSQSQSIRPRKRGPNCAHNLCRRPSALQCTKGKCAVHCIKNGGCPFHPAPPPDITQLDPSLLDVDGFGYYDLHNALSASLTAQGLEAPPPLPAHIPSLHDILTAPSPVPSSSSATLKQVPDPRAALPMSTPVLKMSKPPRITSQLDPMWEKDLWQRAQEEVESERVAERRKEMERKSKQRFILNWFDADYAPVRRQWVSDCKYFPYYQLADDADLVASLGENIVKIEVFDDRLKEWIPALLSHPFTLESECHVFVRRFGVNYCHNFDRLYNASKESMRPPHLRFNIKQERDEVRAKLQVKRAVTPDVEFVDSDSDHLEVEIVEDVQATPKPSVKAVGKRRWDGSPESSPVQSTTIRPPSTRPCLHLDFDDRRATSLSPMPSPSLSPVDSASSSDSLLSAHSISDSISSVDSGVSTEPLIIPVHVPSYKGKHVWPHGMYTCDMIVGFRQMDSPVLRKHYGQEQLFSLVFSGVPFVRATYHDNRSAWANSHVASILLAHNHAGRSPDGLWSCYKASRRHALGEKSKKRSVKSK